MEALFSSHYCRRTLTHSLISILGSIDQVHNHVSITLVRWMTNVLETQLDLLIHSNLRRSILDNARMLKNDQALDFSDAQVTCWRPHNYRSLLLSVPCMTHLKTFQTDGDLAAWQLKHLKYWHATRVHISATRRDRLREWRGVCDQHQAPLQSCHGGPRWEKPWSFSSFFFFFFNKGSWPLSTINWPNDSGGKTQFDRWSCIWCCIRFRLYCRVITLTYG